MGDFRPFFKKILILFFDSFDVFAGFCIYADQFSFIDKQWNIDIGAGFDFSRF